MSRIWFSRRALGLHAVIIVIVPSFMALCIWQLRRALSGNDLSWAYVFEWPFFAGYALYMWWRFVHDVQDEPAGSAPPGGPGPSPAATSATSGPDGAGAVVAPDAGSDGPDLDDPDAAELAAYNRYLAALAAQDERTQHR